MTITASYVSGFFDADGSVEVSPNGNANGFPRVRIDLWNTSLPLIMAIKDFLESIGYHPRIYRTKRERSNPLYDVCIARREEVLRFMREIGSQHPSKQVKFGELLALDRLQFRRNYRRQKVDGLRRAVQEMHELADRLL